MVSCRREKRLRPQVLVFSWAAVGDHGQTVAVNELSKGTELRCRSNQVREVKPQYDRYFWSRFTGVNFAERFGTTVREKRMSAAALPEQAPVPEDVQECGLKSQVNHII